MSQLSDAIRRSPLRLPAFGRDAWLFLASVIIAGVAFSIYQLYFNLYILSLGLGKEFLGLLAAIPAGVTLVLGLPLGVLADRIGRRAALLLGNAGVAAAIVLLISSPSPLIMVAASLLLGISQAIFILSLAPFIMRVSKEETRTALFSAQFGLSTLSGFVGSLLAGQLPGWFAGLLAVSVESPIAYRAAILISALLTFASNIPLWFVRESPPTERTTNADIGIGGLWAQLTRPLVIKLIVPNIFVGFGAAILIPYMNVFFKERYAMPDNQLGLLFSLTAVSTGVATLLGPRLARSLGKVRAVVFTQTASLVFMMAIGFVPGVLIASAAFFMRSALMNMGGPLYQAFSMEQVPDHERATLNSAQTLVWEFGWAFGPAVSGFVQQRFGFAPLFLATTALYGVAAVLTYAFFHNMETKIETVHRAAP